MRKERLLWTLIILLILVNGATLLFIMLPRNPEGVNQFDRTVIGELELDENQIKQFNVMKREHHQEMMRIDKDMRTTYEQYFNLLSDTIEIPKKDSLEAILSNKQKEKIQITYQHFDSLKSICTSEQQEKFKELVPILMNVINPQKKPLPSRRN